MGRLAVVVVLCVALAGAGLLVWWQMRSEAVDPAPSGAPAAPSAEPGAVPATLPPADVIRPRRFEAADEPGAPESAPEAAMDPTRLYVTGKVIDERRRPASGAVLQVMTESRDPLRGKAAADGRFRIDLGPKPAVLPRGCVEASDVKGRVALVALPVPTPWLADPTAGGNVVDVGLLPLADAGALTIRVTKDGTGVPRARVYVGTTQSLGFGPFATDADGSLGARRFPEGRHLVTAFTGDLANRGEASVEVPPRGGGPVEVKLAPAWRLTVRVKEATTGQGVAGQRLDVTSTIRTDERGSFVFPPTLPEPVKPTDADGKSVIAGLSLERAVTVAAAAEERSSPRRAFYEGSGQAAVAKPGTEEVVLEIEGGDTFTFPIVTDETDGPPDGAELKLSIPEGYGSAPPPRRGKVVGRDVVIAGVAKSCINIMATAPDGSRAILRILGEARQTKVGTEAKFKKPRSLVVTAHDRSGAPLAGQVVQCSTPGNVPVGSEATIAADGTARIDGLLPGRVDVAVHKKGERGLPWARVAGTADLTNGDGRVEIIVERERKCVLHVTVDGEKRLPATFRISVMGDRGFYSGEIGAIEEDPEEAVLRFHLRPDPKVESVKLTVSGKGCPGVVVPLALPKDDATLEGTAALVTGGKVVIHVVPPSDNLHQVGLEAWDVERSSWVSRGGGGSPFSAGSEELGRKPTEMTLDALPPGKYRARDASTGLVTDPVELAAGGAAEVTIDLSRSGPITGRVEGPVEGQEASGEDSVTRRRASVIVEGAGLVKARGDGGPEISIDGGIPVRINSEFKARVPGDRPVTFRVKHPLFSPDPEKGSATVTAPGSTVVLELVKGAELRFKVPGAGGGRPGVPGRSGRVLFFEGNPSGEPIYSFDIVWDDGVARFGGFKPRKYTLFCDLGESAPLVLESVELGEGLTDLGELKFPEGATVRVKILTREGQDVSRLYVSASPLEKPQYWRSGGNRGEGDVLLKGLGPGKFKVDVRTGDFRTAPVTYEIVSTGSGEIPLTHDAR